jgi:hypothetical protein
MLIAKVMMWQNLSEFRSFVMITDNQKRMDVVFLIDATGSMSAVLKAAHDKATELAIKLRTQNIDVHINFGCVCYRDPVDSSDVHQFHQLQEDIDALVKFLSTVRATGGGDEPEDWVGGYNLVLNSMQWRDGAKTIIHIADAPAHGWRFCGTSNHDDQQQLLPPLIQEVAKRRIILSCLDLNGGATLSFNECKKIYDEEDGPKCSIERFDAGVGYGEPVSSAAAASVTAEIGECLMDCAECACFDALDDCYG